MERYIDAELAKEALTGWETDPLDEEIERAIDNIPTADVVPKSEVERLQAEIERLKKDNEYILMQHRFQRRPGGDCWNDVIEKAKTEVAREIFEEIERRISDLEYNARTPRKTVSVDELRAQINWVMHEVIPATIAELKKKYTEEKT